MTTHQGKADLPLTPVGKVRVLENMVKDAHALIDAIREIHNNPDLNGVDRDIAVSELLEKTA
jgi:hypothetical protein